MCEVSEKLKNLFFALSRSLAHSSLTLQVSRYLPTTNSKFSFFPSLFLSFFHLSLLSFLIHLSFLSLFSFFLLFFFLFYFIFFFYSKYSRCKTSVGVGLTNLKKLGLRPRRKVRALDPEGSLSGNERH